MNEDLFIGIDTSNYKTSVAVTDRNNNTLFHRSEYLEVPEGSRGLRQSEAFFKHSGRLPEFIHESLESAGNGTIHAIGVSTRPRRVRGSYMPCFLAGTHAARILGSALRIPVYEFSHQEGHAAAIIESGYAEGSDPGQLSCSHSLLFHLSGGTTEVLLCGRDDEGYRLEIEGGTKDISIGQLIDRAGVAMGYPFPSGMYLDELASSYTGGSASGKRLLPAVKVKDGFFNLSGIETYILRTIDSSDISEYPALAYELFRCISELLVKCALEISAGYDDLHRIYMAGGVSSSRFVRNNIREISGKYNGFPELVFGKPELSGDNAIGTAYLARRKWTE